MTGGDRNPTSSEGLLGRAQQRAERAARVEADERDHRRNVMLTLAACAGWALIGLVAVLWSAHTTNARHGWMAVYAGVFVGNGGVLGTLMYAYYRQKKGEW
jgi:hypothetical protein